MPLYSTTTTRSSSLFLFLNSSLRIFLFYDDAVGVVQEECKDIVITAKLELLQRS